MSDWRQTMIDVFEDTQDFYSNNQILKDAINNSRDNMRFYASGDYPTINARRTRGFSLSLSHDRTFKAAMRIKNDYPNYKVGVLNFASAMAPGGGVKTGSSAQEESLCRCSTLYPVLNTRSNWRNFYEVNRKSGSMLNTDDCIYTPDIVICKTDESVPARLSPRDFVKVDVISCAAPDLRKAVSNEYSYMDLYLTYYNRMKHILHIAAFNGIDALVLGAFGCGAFKNSPSIMAKACKDAVDEYAELFKIIEFAIYDFGKNKVNYDAFDKVFNP